MENLMRRSLMMIVFFCAQFGHSAEIIEAKRIKRFLLRDRVQLSLKYAGGCKKHEFSLRLVHCSKHARNCLMELVHNRNEESCEMLVQEDVTLSLPRGRKIMRYDWEILGDKASSVIIKK